MMNRSSVYTGFLLLVIYSLILTGCVNSSRSDRLKESFINPPDSSRPGIIWNFYDGAIDKRSITEDLESMKRAGIGYVYWMDVSTGIIPGTTEIMSKEWTDCFMHAVGECKRLGIKLTIGSSPCESSGGGPWIPSEKSMLHLVCSDTFISGPQVFNAPLPLPGYPGPLNGGHNLPEDNYRKLSETYEDVKILAFPAPENDERISGIGYKALYFRSFPSSEPGYISTGQKADSSYAIIRKEKIQDISFNADMNGNLRWSVPPGRWTVLRFGKRSNGAITEDVPDNMKGWEAGKFDTASVKVHFDEYIGKLAGIISRKKELSGVWETVHINRWGPEAQNWSNNLIEEFIKRRGYDPLLYLPSYAGYVVNNPGKTERFLWDLRLTAGELITENYISYFKGLLKKYGLGLSLESHCFSPSSDMSAGELADLPWGRFHFSPSFNDAISCIEASSSAHLTGGRTVAAKAFIIDSAGSEEIFQGHMKNKTDWAFSMGINRIMFDAFRHIPEGHDTIIKNKLNSNILFWDRHRRDWSYVPDFHRYITRCQFLLSQGKPVADILFITREGAPETFRPPASFFENLSQVPDRQAYTFDVCSPEYFITNARVREGKVIFPSGAKYGNVVLPSTDEMTPDLLVKIERLLREGAFITGFPPKRSPSLSNYPLCDTAVRKTSLQIWKRFPAGGTINKMVYGAGTVFWTNKPDIENEGGSEAVYPSYTELLDKVLQPAGIRADMISPGKIRYLHRSISDREIYFLANKCDSIISDSCFFRDGSAKAEVWDPVTGEIIPLKNLAKNRHGIGTKLTLAPYQSLFLVFYHTDTDIQEINKTYQDIPEKKHVLTIDARIQLSEGSVLLEASFSLPDPVKHKGKSRFYLEPAYPGEISRIILNGKVAGTIWTSPCQIEITDLIRQNDNNLRIETIIKADSKKESGSGNDLSGRIKILASEK